MKPSGFSLIEVVIATAIVVSGVASLAHLLVMSAAAARAASGTTVALLLAAEKLEELSAAPALSPGGGLAADVANYSDRPTGAGEGYIRRWLVGSLPGPGEVFVLQVVVTRGRGAGASGGGGTARLSGVTRR